MALNSRNFKIALVAACLTGALVLAVNRLTTNAVVPPPVEEIAGYKNWTKVNAEPHLMAPQAAKLCVILMAPGGVEVYGEGNPHYEKYITVYVNDAGRKAMLSEKRPKFPAGSVIVKEKLAARDSQSPELLTVMIKRQKGFNPANGDWEYMIVNSAATEIEGRGRLENCQACHLANQEMDYVFRSYLSREVEDSLK